MDSIEKLARLRTDFTYFAPNLLQIRPKEVGSGNVPFRMNAAQQELHHQVELMRIETGKVRVLVLKGRQLGISTYVVGRFYWRTVMNFGVRAFVMAHHQDSTDALFDMTLRYHENNPFDIPTRRSSTKELLFRDLDSGYKVGTAGSKSVGRGQTIQLFHGSEIGFWDNAEEHIGGILEAVPKSDDTEIFLESTANGPQGVFYQMCQRAMRGEGDFRLVFLPWWLDPGYTTEPPVGWEPPEEFAEYRELHDLSTDQIHWAYRKNMEKANALGSEPDEICWLFRQEYPQTAAEAFQTAGDAAFIDARHVLPARKRTVNAAPGTPIVLGVDPAQGAHDRTALIDRQGRRAGRWIDETLDEKDSMSIARHISLAIRRIKPSAVCIDHGGGGKEIADRLDQLGYGSIVHVVNFGSRALEAAKYKNRRAEMYDRMRQWFWHTSGVQIPDDDQLQAELCAAQWGPGMTREDANGKLLIEPKDKIRDRLGDNMSPDLADALALTFAVDVIDDDPEAFFEDDDPYQFGAGERFAGRDTYTGY